jgi:cupin fold WbuC family metalloprotein
MKQLTEAQLTRLAGEAGASARLRKNLNLHQAYDDPIQRLCNAMEPDTYVRPHRHAEPGKWELFMVLRGALAVLTFGTDGAVVDRVELGEGRPARGVEIPPGTWHTLISLQSGTVAFEVKPGPYRPLQDKDFAPWAPAEGDPGTPSFLAWLRLARAGERPPSLPHPANKDNS